MKVSLTRRGTTRSSPLGNKKTSTAPCPRAPPDPHLSRGSPLTTPLSPVGSRLARCSGPPLALARRGPTKDHPTTAFPRNGPPCWPFPRRSGGERGRTGRRSTPRATSGTGQAPGDVTTARGQRRRPVGEGLRPCLNGREGDPSRRRQDHPSCSTSEPRLALAAPYGCWEASAEGNPCLGCTGKGPLGRPARRPRSEAGAGTRDGRLRRRGPLAPDPLQHGRWGECVMGNSKRAVVLIAVAIAASSHSSRR